MATMIALFSVVTVGILLYVGYRISLYLYSHGAVVSQVSSLRMNQEAVQIHPGQELSMEARDYGLRYARVGLMIVILPMLLVVVCVVTILMMMVL